MINKDQYKEIWKSSKSSSDSAINDLNIQIESNQTNYVPTTTKREKKTMSQTTAKPNNLFQTNFNMQNFAQKMLESTFKQVDSYIDVMSGKVGIQTADGLATLLLDEQKPLDSQIEVNMLDLSMAMPAFAMRTKPEAIKPGDILCSGKSDLSFVLKINDKSLEVLKPSGHVSRYNLTKITFNSVQGFFIVKSIWGNMFGEDKLLGNSNPMMPMVMMQMLSGNADSNSMMPMMMMQMMGNMDSNPMMLMMMMQMLSGNADSNSMMTMLMMSQMNK